MVQVTIGKPEDKARLLQTFVLGFAADPMARWATPDPAVYLTRRDEFFDAFGGAAFDHGTVWVAEDGAAVATWLPPGVDGDGERLAAIMAEQTPDSRRDEMDRLFGQMADAHPKEPLWYLPLIATDPAHQGRGLGSALMAAAMARIDETGQPAYLESSNLRNVPFYERFGFKAMYEIRTETSPVLTPMYRAGRG